MAIDKKATCCPDKCHYSKGLCYVCYLEKYVNYLKQTKNGKRSDWFKDKKVEAFEEIISKEKYNKRKLDKIPDLKIEDFQLYNYNKLPRLITV